MWAGFRDTKRYNGVPRAPLYPRAVTTSRQETSEGKEDHHNHDPESGRECNEGCCLPMATLRKEGGGITLITCFRFLALASCCSWSNWKPEHKKNFKEIQTGKGNNVDLEGTIRIAQVIIIAEVSEISKRNLQESQGFSVNVWTEWPWNFFSSWNISVI